MWLWAGVPLYPPTVVYQQLIGETRSRINACKGYQAAHHEWVATLGDRGNNFTHQHWWGTPCLQPPAGCEASSAKQRCPGAVKPVWMRMESVTAALCEAARQRQHGALLCSWGPTTSQTCFVNT